MYTQIKRYKDKKIDREISISICVSVSVCARACLRVYVRVCVCAVMMLYFSQTVFPTDMFPASKSPGVVAKCSSSPAVSHIPAPSFGLTRQFSPESWSRNSFSALQRTVNARPLYCSALREVLKISSRSTGRSRGRGFYYV